MGLWNPGGLSVTLFDLYVSVEPSNTGLMMKTMNRHSKHLAEFLEQMIPYKFVWNKSTDEDAIYIEDEYRQCSNGGHKGVRFAPIQERRKQSLVDCGMNVVEI